MDTREFNKAVREIARTDEKEWSFILNRQTKKTPTGKIRRELNKRQHIASRVFSKRGKRLKRQAKIKARDTLAERMVNRIRVDRGEKPIWGAKRDAEVERFIGNRERSAAFLASGFIPAIGVFMRALGRGGLRKKHGRAAVHGQPHGTGIAAKKGRNPAAWIINAAIEPHGKYSTKTGNPMKWVLKGAKKTLEIRTDDMRKKVIERLNRAHKPHQGKSKAKGR
jgi:hypothetical protein